MQNQSLFAKIAKILATLIILAIFLGFIGIIFVIVSFDITDYSSFQISGSERQIYNQIFLRTLVKSNFLYWAIGYFIAIFYLLILLRRRLKYTKFLSSRNIIISIATGALIFSLGYLFFTTLSEARAFITMFDNENYPNVTKYSFSHERSGFSPADASVHFSTEDSFESVFSFYKENTILGRTLPSKGSEVTDQRKYAQIDVRLPGEKTSFSYRISIHQQTNSDTTNVNIRD